MKIQYFGTAAAEGFPAMFCQCDACFRAIDAGGKNIRTRSQALIDDRLLIDFPPDTYMHVLHGGLKLDQINTCIVTHNHSDHLYAPDFHMRRKTFAYPDDMAPLHIYGTAPVGVDFDRAIDKDQPVEKTRMVFHEITAFVPFEAERYTITPLKANHPSAPESVIFLIGDGQKNLLYANDTGWFPEETLYYLKSNKIRLDYVSMDCTNGFRRGCRDHHLGLDTVVQTVQLMKDAVNVNSSTQICVNHFSHNGLATYDEILPVAAEYGFLVSYDGMIVDF